jgi:hypothetical protein
MKMRTFFMIASVLGFLFAIGLILAPAFMDSAYGTGPSAGEMLTDRLYGSGILALSVITWLAKDLTGASVRPIITGSLIGGLVGFVVSLMGMLGDVMNSTGWSTVVIYLFLTLGFAYFQFMAPPK